MRVHCKFSLILSIWTCKIFSIKLFLVYDCLLIGLNYFFTIICYCIFILNNNLYCFALYTENNSMNLIWLSARKLINQKKREIYKMSHNFIKRKYMILWHLSIIIWYLNMDLAANAQKDKSQCLCVVIHHQYVAGIDRVWTYVIIVIF